jgi:hypothetical protein
MNRELEALLKAWDEFIQAPTGPEAERIHALYQARLDYMAELSKVSKEALHRSVIRYHERGVRANLPPGFPKDLGLQ